MSRLFSLSAARRLAAPVAAVAASAWMLPSKTRAEEASIPAKDEDDDPYAILPEKDERTHCTLCLVNRQGPCRDPWRRFELCMKDHHPPKKAGQTDNVLAAASTEEGRTDPVCDKYAFKWIECTSSYQNLYYQYFNDLMLLDFVHPLEEAIRPDEKVDWPTDDEAINVDWTPYTKWIDKENYSLYKLAWTIQQVLWYRPTTRPVFYGQDPVLVEVDVSVPLEMEGLCVEVAYAKDQSGILLGLVHYDAKKEKDGRLPFVLRLSPESTQTVEFCALYKGKDDDDQARFYCGKPTKLLKVAKDAGIRIK